MVLQAFKKILLIGYNKFPLCGKCYSNLLKYWVTLSLSKLETKTSRGLIAFLCETKRTNSRITRLDKRLKQFSNVNISVYLSCVLSTWLLWKHLLKDMQFEKNCARLIPLAYLIHFYTPRTPRVLIININFEK